MPLWDVPRRLCVDRFRAIVTRHERWCVFSSWVRSGAMGRRYVMLLGPFPRCSLAHPNSLASFAMSYSAVAVF